MNQNDSSFKKVSGVTSWQL